MHVLPIKSPQRKTAPRNGDAGESFGRVFQGTEGVGEMAEAKIRWLCSPRQDSGFPSLAFAIAPNDLAALERNREAFASVPPTPPVVHLSRPVSGDHRSALDLGRPV
jgi:hypothetical protein